jgi:hypothetical protein
MPKTSTERVRLLRERKASSGLTEVRGVFAPKEFHSSVKGAATGLMSSANRSAKVVGLLLMESDGSPSIDLAASRRISIDEVIAFLESVPDSVRATIAQLERDSR